MNRKKGIFFGFIAIISTVFILFIIIMQNGFNSSPTVAQKDSEQIHSKEETDKEVEIEGESDLETVDKKQEEDSPTPSKDSKVETKSTEETDPKEEAQVEVDKKQEPVTYSNQFVRVSSLNVRQGPGVDSEVIGILKINQAIQASDSATEDGWVQMKTNNISGYVNTKYLSDQKVAVQKVAKAASTESEQNSTQNADTNAKETKQETSEKQDGKEEETQKTENPVPKQNDADKLKTIDGNNQLILVTSDGYGTSSARVQTYERTAEGNWKQLLDVSGFVGKNGFADNKVEGDGKTPIGKYTIGHAFGRAGNPGTKLSYRAITPDDVWVDDSNSSLYNSWQSKAETSDQWSSAENMDIALYTHGFVINYNTAQTPGKGSAIFFHIANGYTLGCVGVSESNVVSILKWLDPKKNPVIIQTPTSGLGNY
ncbi:L,D-transpeptidase family protein [Oceanobacillus sp. CF4.6]|uniref:L,D-transpeptidase family protein n=1 Tax=Oceanobacillus sp. CF4.6 TaxID=3373080 RepID=UPI003EE57D71